jgi:uncharacterized protein YggT (Ycf19 family)
VTALGWWLASWGLEYFGIVPHPASAAHRVEQAAVIGLGSYLAWKYLLILILGLHLLGSYVYFGRHPFWLYVNANAQPLLRPLRMLPLRLARIDFAPVLALVLVWFAAQAIEQGINFSARRHLPGLRDLYEKLEPRRA